MKTSIQGLIRASRIPAAFAAAVLVCCSHAKAQTETPEQTYDGAIAKGTPGYSKTTETEPNGYIEKTWIDDGTGKKKLVEIRHYDKKKPPLCLDHWITYTGTAGETITDDYGWSVAGGQTATRVVEDATGTTTYTWEPTPPRGGKWKKTGFTPPPTPTPTPSPTPTPTSKKSD